MPRYIDADAAIELVRLTYCKDCNSYNGVMCRACQFDNAMLLIDDIPAADVVPRAVIAEIFADIERLLAINFCSCLPSGATEHYNYFEGDLADDVAEIKKKYTEEKT